jgi:DNA-binding NarL/FixJ family response regulator
MDHTIRQFALDRPMPVELSARLQRLTPQQTRVSLLLSEGLSNKEIAIQLAISEATIKSHISAILRAFDCHNRTQAAILLYRLRLDNARAAA